MPIFPKLIYIINTIPIKIPSWSFCRNHKLNLELKENAENYSSQNNFLKEEKCGKLYYKTTIIKSVQCWWKDKK